MWVPLGSTVCFPYSSKEGPSWLYYLPVFINNLNFGQDSYATLMRMNPGSTALSRILNTDLMKLLAWQSVFSVICNAEIEYTLFSTSPPMWVPGWFVPLYFFCDGFTHWIRKGWIWNSSRSCTSLQIWRLYYSFWGCAIISWDIFILIQEFLENS